MKGYGQKIDRSAMTQIHESARSYPAGWGEAEVTAQGLVYGSPDEGPERILVTYEAKKQLLGGVFNLVIQGECGGCPSCMEGDAEMFYGGRFFKGEAYFKPGKEGGPVAGILNGNGELLKDLTRLDLLSMIVTCQDGRLVWRLSPLGGAFSYTVFPPVKYGGVLPRGDIEAIGRIMNLIADGFREKELAAGAEI